MRYRAVSYLSPLALRFQGPPAKAGEEWARRGSLRPCGIIAAPAQRASLLQIFCPNNLPPGAPKFCMSRTTSEAAQGSRQFPLGPAEAGQLYGPSALAPFPTNLPLTIRKAAASFRVSRNRNSLRQFYNRSSYYSSFKMVIQLNLGDIIRMQGEPARALLSAGGAL